jgi:molecular chaperone HscB
MCWCECSLRRPKQFKIDPKSLNKRFQRLQLKLHPDHYQKASELEQHISAESAALVNRAYRTLLDPQQRAEYMLESEGIKLEEAMKKLTTPELLEEMMVLREQVTEATFERDPATLTKMQLSAEVGLNECYQEFHDAFEQQDMQRAQQVAIRINYLTRVKEELHQALEEHM